MWFWAHTSYQNNPLYLPKFSMLSPKPSITFFFFIKKYTYCIPTYLYNVSSSQGPTAVSSFSDNAGHWAGFSVKSLKANSAPYKLFFSMLSWLFRIVFYSRWRWHLICFDVEQSVATNTFNVFIESLISPLKFLDCQYGKHIDELGHIDVACAKNLHPQNWWVWIVD